MVTGPKEPRAKPKPRADLQTMLFVVPNAITLASVFCGFRAITSVALDNPTLDDFFRGAIFLTIAMLFDLLDGRVARMTRTQSAFGVQLDSLADVISFGVAPALLTYKWVLVRHPALGLLVAFVYVACGALRLARFNVLAARSPTRGSKPGKYVTGLPIPPASGVLISLLLVDHALGGALSAERHTLMIFLVTLGLGLLMVSNVRFRSFKDLRLSGPTLLLVSFAIVSSAVVWQFTRPPFVLLWLLGCYVLLGLFEGVRDLLTPGRKHGSALGPPPKVGGDDPPNAPSVEPTLPS